MLTFCYVQAALEAKRKGNKTEVVLKKVETKDSYRSVRLLFTLTHGQKRDRQIDEERER